MHAEERMHEQPQIHTIPCIARNCLHTLNPKPETRNRRVELEAYMCRFVLVCASVRAVTYIHSRPSICSPHFFPIGWISVRIYIYIYIIIIIIIIIIITIIIIIIFFEIIIIII